MHAHTDSSTRRSRAEVNSSGFPAPPARHRRALKLEIPATTEWTEREGTCLGRRNCPFSASMHLFTVLYRAVTFRSSLSRFFLVHSLFFFFFYCCFLVRPVFPRSRFIPSFPMRPCLGVRLGCVSMCWSDGGRSACDGDGSMPECRGAPHHVLARPLNTLMFYGCSALPVPMLLKSRRSLFQLPLM